MTQTTHSSRSPASTYNAQSDFIWDQCAQRRGATNERNAALGALWSAGAKALKRRLARHTVVAVEREHGEAAACSLR